MTRTTRDSTALATFGVAVLVAILCLLGSGLASAATINPAQQVLGDNGRPLGVSNGGAGSTVHMHFASSGKCIAMGSTSHALRWDCDGGHAEEFTQQDNHDGSWSFRWTNQAGVRYCLESQDGQYLNIPICNGSAAQRWTVGSHGELLSVGSPWKCSTDPSTSSTNGVRLVMQDCTAYPRPTPAAVAPPVPPAPVARPTTPAAARNPADTPFLRPTSAQQTPTTPAVPAPTSQAAPSSELATPSASSTPSSLYAAPFAAPTSTAPPSHAVAPARPSVATRTVVPVVVALALLLLLGRFLPWYLPALARRTRTRLASAVPRRGSALVSALTTFNRQLKSVFTTRFRSRSRIIPPTVSTVAQSLSGPAGAVSSEPTSPLAVEASAAGASAVAGSPGSGEAEAATEEPAGAPVNAVELAGGLRLGSPGLVQTAAQESRWEPHPLLFSVFTSWDAERAAFVGEQGDIGLLEMSERVRACSQWQGRPVLLVPGSAPAGWAVQLIADSLQVPVVAGTFDTQWWVTSPRSAERGWAPPRPLTGAYPFAPADIARLDVLGPTLPVPSATVPPDALQLDKRGLAFLPAGESQPVAAELEEWRRDRWQPGLYAVAVRRPADSPLTPYEFSTTPWSAWDLAVELWAVRAHWKHARTLCLLTDGPVGADELELRLLSLYLGVAVADARGCLPGIEAGGAGQADAGAEGAVLSATAEPAPPESGGDDEVLPPAQVALPEGLKALVAPIGLSGIATTVTSEPASHTPGAVRASGRMDEAAGGRGPQHQVASVEADADGAVGIDGAGLAGADGVPEVGSIDAAGARPGVLNAPPLLEPGHRSTAEERSRFRELMQRRYDVHARAITQTLATRPGLRSGSGGSAVCKESDVCDLAAVRALVSGEWPQGQEPAHTAAWTACVTSGLRMLPTYRGAAYVWCGWEEIDPSALSVGQLVTSAHVLRARLGPGVASERPAVEAVVWSESGRRTRMLVPEGVEEEVLFPGRTAFRVLALRAGGGGAQVPQILLRQLTGQESVRARTAEGAGPEPLGERDFKVRSRLLAALGESAEGEAALNAVTA